jgi:peptidoglycan/LPS O-acetylase OafA/YrhL
VNDAGAAIPRMPFLDALRGIAIALVVVMHFGVAADFVRRSAHARLGRYLERLFYLGWAGVDLFFVLSGFLITSILLATRDQPHYFRSFYARRALRILPLYYTAVLLVVVVVPRLWPAEASSLVADARSGQIWLWTYSLNIADTFNWIGSAGVLAHFWTLAIEEQYYLVWPSIVKVLSERRLFLLCGALAVGALCFRIVWVVSGFPDGWDGAYRFTLTRVDALAIGSACAVIVRRRPADPRLASIVTAAAALTMVPIGCAVLILPRFYPSEFFVVTFGHSMLAFLFGCLVIAGARRTAPVSGRWAVLRWLGKYSYGIYVWHWPLHRVMGMHLQAFTPIAFLSIGIAGSLLLGYASYHVIEAPFLRLRSLVKYE